MDLLEKYREEVGKDLVLDDFNIKNAQMKLPSRKHYWVARLIDAKIDLNRLFSKKKDVKKQLLKKIAQESPVKLTSQNMENIADNTDEIKDINSKIKDFEILIEYLEKIEKILSTMHWEIKNIIQLNEQERL